MNFETLVYRNENGVTTICLNRPDRYNAFNEQMRQDLLAALQVAENDSLCRVIVLSGEGKAFCSGQDLKDIEGKDIDFSDFLKTGYNPVIRAMRNMPKPIIARVNGVAAGAGCSLALACDFIIADERASFVEVFVGIGLVLDSGSSYFLPRLVGSNRAFELATMGKKVSASKALEWGMINRAVDTTVLDVEVEKVAQYYANAPTLAIASMKRMLNDSLVSTLDQVLDYEAHYQQIAGSSADYQEGVAAFLEKRKPAFKGS
ncbi:enoyl-CoA hydratase-related protein [Bacteroidia bacterium]|jgi:2-(1,2-epoxy-1,2-dihydrophenyl)acetyl-CoA isomerase|nr:enoyl-CoA hydratase-related protein [Bacteroidia bacterium]